MGFLTDFEAQESARIGRLFELIDRFEASEVDGVLKTVFSVYASRGFMGRAVLESLKKKISAACRIPGANLTDAEFVKAFIKLEDGVKRSLLVTIANDCCKLGVLNEAQVFTFLQNELAKMPTAAATVTTPKVKPKDRM